MSALIQYDAARKALAAARATDEVKKYCKQAEMQRAYARLAKDRTMEIDAAEIRIRAERRLGELIKGQKETIGLNPGSKRRKGSSGRKGRISGSAQEPLIANPPKLADADIDKKLSSRAQKLAAIPDNQFESRIEKWRTDLEQAEKKPVAATLLHKDSSPKEKRPKKNTTSVDGFSPSVECFLAVEAIINEHFFDLDIEGQDDLIGRLQQLITQLETHRRRTA